VNVAWLIESRTIRGALILSGVLSTLILVVHPDGLPSLRKREAELRAMRRDLLQKNQENQVLMEEVRRLASKDPETFEALARRHGFARPGEKVYTFGDRGRR